LLNHNLKSFFYFHVHGIILQFLDYLSGLSIWIIYLDYLSGLSIWIIYLDYLSGLSISELGVKLLGYYISRLITNS